MNQANTFFSRKCAKVWRAYVGNTGGNFAITTAFGLLGVLIAIGSATDYAKAQHAKSSLQNVLDSSVLAVAIQDADDDHEQQKTAKKVFQANWSINPLGTAPTPTLSVSGDEFTLTATKAVPTNFAGILGKTHIDVRATATAVKGGTSGAPCVLSLDPIERKTLDLTGGSSIDAPDCDVYVNSTDPEAVNLTGGARINANRTCVEGGIKSLAENITPPAQFNCGVKADPMAGFTPPSVGSCDHTDFEESGGVTITMWPGVYCGGLKLTGGASAHYQPGTYVIKDGPLETTGGGDFVGNGVTFHITGNDAYVNLSGGAIVHLSAPTTGPFQGVVFYQDPNFSLGLDSKLSGGGELYFEGVIYFPTQELNVSGGGLTTTHSPFTWYIANNFLYSGGSELIINSDLDASSVPLPRGVALNRTAHLIH